MTRRIALSCALLVGLAWLPAQAQVLPIYDDFNGHQINPAKWMTPPACTANDSSCVRKVHLGHLHLAVNGNGAADPDSGVTFAESQVLFQNPEPIETIRFRFTVTRSSARACPSGSNPEAAHPQLLLHGAFFNAGTGLPEDDVIAYLMVERRTDDLDLPPAALRVAGFTSKGDTFSEHVDLGTLWVWEPAVATLRWDRANHAFVWQVVKVITHPHVAEGTLPYGEGDTTPPAEPFKSLRVGAFAPNCAQPGFAAMDAFIDNVRVNRP